MDTYNQIPWLAKLDVNVKPQISEIQLAKP
jgi:hypothetical protein